MPEQQQIHFQIQRLQDNPHRWNFKLAIPNSQPFTQLATLSQLQALLQKLRSGKKRIKANIGKGKINITGLGIGQRQQMSEYLELVLEGQT